MGALHEDGIINENGSFYDATISMKMHPPRTRTGIAGDCNFKTNNPPTKKKNPFIQTILARTNISSFYYFSFPNI